MELRCFLKIVAYQNDVCLGMFYIVRELAVF